MAIIRTKETSQTVLDKKERTKQPKEKAIKNTQKKGFFRSTWEELKLVQWPTWQYTLKWAGIVVLFTLILTVFIGGVDKLFQSGFNYASCTARYYQGTGGSDYEQCGREFLQSFTRI